MSKKVRGRTTMEIKRRQGLGYRLAAVAVVALGTAAAVLSETATGERYESRASRFCGTPIIRDYEAPLRLLPGVEELPESRELPFAPPNVEVVEVDVSRLRVEFAGFVPVYQITNKDLHSPVSLEWTVKIRLSRVFLDGSVVPVSESSEKVGTIAPGQTVQLLGGSTTALGSYRVDISFSNDAGQTLGSYSEYIRVVRSTLKVRLGLSRRSIWPGEVIKPRVENIGTQAVTYSLVGRFVERFDDGRWVGIPQPPAFAVGEVVLAGMAGRCWAVALPAPVQPGRYRARQNIVPRFAKGKKNFFITAYFKVLSFGREGRWR